MAKTAFPRAALLALSVSLSLPAALAAQEPARADSLARADSAAAAVLPSIFGPEPSIRLGLKPVDSPFRIRFRPAPGLDRPDLWPRFEDRWIPAPGLTELRPRDRRAAARPELWPRDDWAADWARARAERFELRRDSLWLAAARSDAPAGPDTVAYLPSPARTAQRDSAGGPGILGGELGNFADLGMRISGRGEMGGSWNRFEPCDASFALNCNPSLFPQLRPDVQFGVQVAGTVSDRVHVNVDYDQRREFDAANNIHVYYQGFEDEILQRLEVGDVSFNLPASRFLTQGVPAGNFGFKATGQVGPIDFQTVWAQQKGDVNRQEFKLGGGAGSQGLVQDLEVVRDDADYARGQFFYLVHPDSILGAPHVDPLALRGGEAPASMAPRGAVAVFRYEGNTVLNPQQQGQLGYFRADAVSPTAQTTHSGLWRRLYGNEDFQIHPSGLWIVLRAPLGRDEALAVAYETQDGTIVGTLNPEEAPQGTVPTLRLIRGPEAVHQPDHVSGTWPYEMHQVYRVDASSGVERGSVEMEISLGELSAGATYADAPTGEQVPYLRLFGLDEDSPIEKLDEAQIFRPAELWGEEGNRITGVYVVLPTLEPFRQPPPVPSANLSAEEALQALGNASNATIYRNPDPLTRTGGARFRLNFAYRVRTEGLVSSFSLGALGIREGTDRILVDGRQLTRGEDYTIDYDIGMVTLTNPDGIFGANPDAQIRATWEQKALFQLAPTSVFGLNARYALGDRGELNFISMYQTEKSLTARPTLGLEPASIFLSGVGGSFQLGGRLLDRAVEAIPGLRSGGGSTANLTGEIALSSPNPNTRGETYLDDFEAADEIRLGVDPHAWRLGSVPGKVDGAAMVLPPILDVTSAGHMVWQSLFQHQGQVVGPHRAAQIDRQINVRGNEIPEPVMYLTFGDSLSGEERLWRSMTTVLSTTGRDLSQSEYLELYVNFEPEQNLSLIFDVGTVSEDAFYFDSTGARRGTYPDGEAWGEGELDQEGVLGVDVWGDPLDQRGLWDQPCLSQRGEFYPLTDPRANCTRGNGVRDSEDLDGNGVLAAEDGQYFRYVVELDQTPYLVRGPDDPATDSILEGTGTNFALYRIPLREAGISVNGADASTWRFIKHLRMTVAGTPGVGQLPQSVMVIAKPRIVGSRWPKRDAHGIMAGLTGGEPGSGAGSTRLRVGPVSRITDADYRSPPGVVEQLQDPTTAFSIGGTDITEKGIKLSFEDLPSDERAEVYFRYPQQPRNFLDYRTLRLWALPRSGSWGETGEQWLVVKVGTDARNAYLYRTRLHPGPGEGGSASGADWTELTIELEEWFALKARAERMLIEQAASGEAAPTEFEPIWSEDGRYGIVLQDRFQAPNLAAVRELSFAVYNEGGLPASGEVWLNELRMGQPMRETGIAGHIDLNVRAADFLRLNASYSNEGALFRRGMEGGPTYQRTGSLNVSADANLGRFAPAGWGLEMPLSVSHTRSGQDPFFLQQSDVRADRLEGLRETGADNTRVGISIRKRTPTSNPWLSLLVDGVSLSANYRTATTGAISSKNEASGFQTGLSYSRQPGARDFSITPGFLDGILRAIFPSSLETSELFRSLTGARLRWTPEVLSFSHQYNSNESRSWRYDQILELPGDSLVKPLLSPRQGLDSNVRIGFRPFETLTADVTVTTSRDLLEAELASKEADERQAIEGARGGIAGMDLGWERNRNVTSQLSWRPRVTPWLSPRFGYNARYSMERSPAYLEAVVVEGDSTYAMQRQFRGQRTVTRGLDLQPIGMVSALLGAEAGDNIVEKAVYAAATAIQPVTLAWTSSLNSTFDRETSAPGLGYQLGLGDLHGYRFLEEGDTAKTAAEQASFQAGTGLALPLGTSVTLGYSTAEGQVFDLRGGEGFSRQKSWPDVGVSWSKLPIPSFMSPVLKSAIVSTGFRRQVRTETLQERFREDESIPLQLSLTFPRGMALSYTGTVSGGTGEDPTGRTEQSSLRHSLTGRSSFAAPGSLKDTFRQPIQASLRFSLDAQRNCRVRTGTEQGVPCTPFQDFENRSLDLTLDTVIRELSVGLQASYVDRQSFVGQRNGSSQFQFSIFGQFNFAAGSFPSTQIPGRGIR